MKKNIVIITLLLACIVFSSNLICMDNHGNDETKILESLKSGKGAKEREIFVEVLHEGFGTGLKSKIGACLGRYFDKGEDIYNFFEFNCSGGSCNQIRQTNNNLSFDEKGGDKKFKKLGIRPFNSPTLGELGYNSGEEYSKSAPNINNFDRFMEKKSKFSSNITFSDNIVNCKNKLYSIEVYNNLAKIIKKINGKVVFDVRVPGSICNIGAKVYFDSDLSRNKDLYGIEYVIIIFTDNKKWDVFLYDEDETVIFNKQVDKKVNFYIIFDLEKCEFLVKNRFLTLVYDNSVELFDINKGTKIAGIDCEGKVVSYFVGSRGYGIFFSVNNIMKLIFNNKKTKAYKFENNIISGLLYLKYIVFMSKSKNSCSLNFFDIESDRMIDCFESSESDSFDIGRCKIEKESKKLYFWTKDKYEKSLKLYSICENAVKKLFDGKFNDTIRGFNVDYRKSKPIRVYFLNSKDKDFPFCLKNNHSDQNDDFIIVNNEDVEKN